jgi:CheY-like chemotaxis protein
VTNGREAVELAAREDFDFVFLDIQTPEMGGYEAARSLRDAHQGRRRPRLIGLSGDQDEAQFYATAGMDAFLAKPVRLAELKHALVEDWPTRVDHQKGD